MQYVHKATSAARVLTTTCALSAALGLGGCHTRRVAQAPRAIHAPHASQAPRPAAIPHPIRQPVARIHQPKLQPPHRFTYIPPAGSVVKSVAIAGDFDGWSTTADRLHKQSNGHYSIALRLPRGIHHYKFVINENKWTPDPRANPKYNQPDNFGGHNSGVKIGPSARAFPKPGPNTITIKAVRFEPKNYRDVDVFGKTLIRITLRAQAHDITSVHLLTQTIRRNAPARWHSATLHFTDQRHGFSRYGTVLRVRAPALRYVFKLRHGSKILYLASQGFYTNEKSAMRAAYTRAMETSFHTPRWARHAVWYQIFPERFRNGSKANDPPHTVPWTAKWYSRQPGEKGTFYQYIYNRFYGGDLQGVIQKLHYLRRLGVNALYFTPLFKAPSIHKYDTQDFRHIDDHFGFKGDIKKLHGETANPKTWKWTKSDRLFLHLVSLAHQQGFHVIMDGVFEDSGKKFFAFKNLMKYGKKSPYKNWYQVRSFGPPVQYNAWDGVNGALPLFRRSKRDGLARGPRKFLLAVTRRWMAPNGDVSRGIDGWRMDSAPSIPHAFWRIFRKFVKRINPNAILVGEIWSQARSYLRGHQFDATMNYPFASAATGFFCGGNHSTTPAKFGRGLESLLNARRWQVNVVEQDLLDSHDTDRFASRFMNPGLPFNAKDRVQDSNPQYNVHKPTPLDYRRMRQGVALQMTFVGAPMVYYGDETGMWGASDPSDRQPMVWKDLEPYADPNVRFSQRQFNFYQRAIATHRQLTPLQVGYFRSLKTRPVGGGGTGAAAEKKAIFAFARDIGPRHVYVLLNRSGSPHTVQFRVSASDRKHTLLNYLDPAELKLTFATAAPAARPVLTAIPGAKGYLAKKGWVRITLPAYKSAILTAALKAH